MDPVTALMIGSTALTAFSTVSQGVAAKNAAKFNAAMAERNAGIARAQAAADAEAQSRDARRRIGAARAAYGASGVTVEGSPLDVLERSAWEAEMDNQNILYRGELRAMGYTDTATLERYSGNNAFRSGLIGATGTLLGGAGRAMWLSGQMGGGGAWRVPDGEVIHSGPTNPNAYYPY